MKKFFKKVSGIYHQPHRALHKVSDPSHLHFMNKGGRYHRWHQSPHHRTVHFGTLTLVVLLIVLFVLAQLLPRRGLYGAVQQDSITVTTQADFDKGTLTDVESYDATGGIRLPGIAQSITWGDTGAGSDINLTFDGNSTLDSTRNISEGAGDDSIALEFNEAPVEADMELLWRFNEESWDGTPGEVLDATGNGDTGHLGSVGFVPTSDWLNNYANHSSGTPQFAEDVASGGSDVPHAYCFWAKVVNPESDWAFVRRGSWEYVRINQAAAPSMLTLYKVGDVGESIVSTLEVPHDGAWHYIAVLVHTSPRQIEFFLDDTWDTQSYSYAYPGWGGNELRVHHQIINGGGFDDFASFWNGVPSHAWIEAQAKRFNQGTAIVNYDLGGGSRTFQTLSWNALESGDWEGDISRIDVYGADSQWHQVGGDSPTSPIEGIGLEVSSNVQIKYTLDPKSDTLQTETPKLQDVTATVSAIQPTGTYLSPSSTGAGSGILDTVWNGGWGDGTPSSTAFSATVDTPGDTKIALQFRSSETGGADPNWSDWYPADTTTFETDITGTYTLTASQLSTVPQGTNRYVQTKITLKSPTQSSNPSLTDYTIYFLEDITDPTNPSTINSWDTAAKANSISDDSWGNYTQPHFEFSGAIDDNSGVKGYYVYWGEDNTTDPLTGGVYQAHVGVAEAAQSYTISTELTEADNGKTFYLCIRTIDNAEHLYTNGAPDHYKVFTYKFENQAPDAPEYVNVSPMGCSTSSTFTFTWPSVTDPVSGTAGYQYKLGSIGTVQDTTETEIESAPYQEGDNVFYIRTKDNAGNTSNWQTGVFCSTGIAHVVDGPGVTAGPSSLNVSWTSDKSTTSYVRVYEGNQYVSEQGQTAYAYSHQVRVVGLKSETAYRYKLVWTDQNGNLGESIWYQTNTATAPSIKNPSVSILSPSEVLLSWETSYSAECSIEYGIGGLTNTINIPGSGTAFSYKLENLSPGSNYQARMKGLVSDGTEFYVTLSFTTPPFPTISNVRFDYIPEAKATIRVTWTTNVETDSAVTYTSPDGVSNEESSSKMTKDHAIAITGLLDDTEYTITVSGRDQYGNRAVSDSQRYTTPLDTRPPKILDLEVEYRTVGTGREAKAQIIISWKTDEPATSQVAYGEGMTPTFTLQSTRDESLVTDHLVILRDLKTAQIYHLRAVSEDRGENTTNSETRIIVTPKAQESVLDIILEIFKDSFGWLIDMFK